jgi:signal transduction histidine kinase
VASPLRVLGQRADARDDRAQRPARVVAGARLALSMFAYLAFAAHPAASGPDAHLVSGLLLAYVLYAACLRLAGRFSGVAGGHVSWGFQLLDAIWIAAIILATGGADGPFFLLAAFSLFSAAYRWGLQATIGTAVLLIALLLVSHGPLASWTGGEAFTGGHVTARAAAVLAGAALFGGLAAQEHEARDTAANVARIARRLRPGEDPSRALHGALSEMRAVFNARSVLLVARDEATSRLYRWNATSTDEDAAVVNAVLDRPAEAAYLFPVSATIASAVRHGDGRVEVLGLHEGETRPRASTIAWPPQFLAAHPLRSLLVASAPDADRWVLRLLLVDAPTGARQLRGLRAIVREVMPVIYGVELLAQLRAHVVAAERARLARDLHDGVIQSLVALEMTVDVWRRDAADSAAASQLRYIQNTLRTEVLDLRDLMVRTKSAPIDPKRVMDELAAIVERFERDSGIAADFIAEIEELDLAPHVCDEIVRIVQEALVNVRRHSGARHVVVRVAAGPDHWTFEVDDDGRGFGFDGRQSQADLDRDHKGPAIISERVRSIGGRLSVESGPGQGARLEISVPRRTHG